MNKLNSKNQIRTAERGSVIIFTILILGSMLAITLSLSAIFGPKVAVVQDASTGSVGAVYAAESALEWCIYTNRGGSSLPQPVMLNGATYTIQPSDCSITPLNHRVVGTYHNVSRSFEVTTP